MITVPTLGDDRVNLNPTNTQRVQTQAPDFGDASQRQLQQATGQLANTALKVEQAEIEKANQIIDMETDVKLGELETDLLYNTDSGALNKLGKDSFGTPDTVGMDWEFGVKEIEKGLSTDRQRANFRKRVQQRKANIDKNLMRHISKESLQYDNQVTDSYIANEKNTALENFFDEERVDSSVARQRQAIINHADRNGLPAEYKKQKIKELQSETYSGVITRILDGGADLEAKAYYEKNKHLIDAKHQRGIEKQLEVGSLMGEAQRATDEIFGKTTDFRKALETARKIKDPKKRDEVVKRVKSRISEEKMLEAESDKNNFDKAFHTLEGSKSIDSIPPSVLSRLSLPQKQALERRAQQLNSGLPIKTDLGAYYNLELMASNPKTRDKFLRLNLNTMRDKLGDSDFKKFVKMQADVASGKSTANKLLDGLQSKNSIIGDTLKIIGVESGSKADPDDIKKAQLFRKRVDDEVILRQEQTGKKVNNEDLRKITESLATEFVVGSKYFGLVDKRKRSFEIDTSDIPSELYDSYRDALSERGLPATDDNIMKLYQNKLKKEAN